MEGKTAVKVPRGVFHFSEADSILVLFLHYFACAIDLHVFLCGSGCLVCPRGWYHFINRASQYDVKSLNRRDLEQQTKSNIPMCGLYLIFSPIASCFDIEYNEV